MSKNFVSLSWLQTSWFLTPIMKRDNTFLHLACKNGKNLVYGKISNQFGVEIDMLLRDKREYISVTLTPTVFPSLFTKLRKLCQSHLKCLMIYSVFFPPRVIAIALMKSFKVPPWIINSGRNWHSS